MGYTKNNGKVIKRTSKKLIEKNKVTYPKYKLGKTNSTNPFVKNFISFKKDNLFIKAEIKNIEYHPIPKYKSKAFLVKDVIVNTKEGNLVKIVNLNYGRILGSLQSNS